jgi:hypothetical protein
MPPRIHASRCPERTSTQEGVALVAALAAAARTGRAWPAYSPHDRDFGAAVRRLLTLHNVQLRSMMWHRPRGLMGQMPM